MTAGFGLTERDKQILHQALEEVDDSLERVGVFGSRAQGREKPNSDLDLVLYGAKDKYTAGRLMSLLQESSLPISVDIVVYETLNNHALKEHIDLVSKPLFVKTENGWIDTTSQ